MIRFNNIQTEALFLDMDDTILAYSSLQPEAWQKTMDQLSIPETLGRDLVNAINQENTAFWYRGNNAEYRVNLTEARKIIVSRAMKRVETLDEKLIPELVETFSAIRQSMVHPFPGSMETLQRMRDLDVGMVLITNGASETQRAKIKKFSLERYFDHIIIEEEVGFGKPSRDIFQLALSLAACDAKSAWMIGNDLFADIEGAKGVGLNTVYINRSMNSKDLLPAFADLMVPAISNIKKSL